MTMVLIFATKILLFPHFPPQFPKNIFYCPKKVDFIDKLLLIYLNLCSVRRALKPLYALRTSSVSAMVATITSIVYVPIVDKLI